MKGRDATRCIIEMKGNSGRMPPGLSTECKGRHQDRSLSLPNLWPRTIRSLVLRLSHIERTQQPWQRGTAHNLRRPTGTRESPLSARQRRRLAFSLALLQVISRTE